MYPYSSGGARRDRRDDSMSEPRDQYTLQSVSNALSILDLLAEFEELSAMDIARRMKIGQATAFRLLHTLEQHNYVVKSAQAKFRLSIKLASLGEIVTRRMEIVRVVHPYLEELSRQFMETAHLVVWNTKMDVIVADRVIGLSPISYKTSTGFITPAHVAASGRILLAYTDEEHLEEYIRCADFSLFENNIHNEQELRSTLSRIRHCGVAENEGDAIPGLSCYAVPIFNGSGRAIASLSISGAQANLNRCKERIIEALRTSAERIDRRISFSPGAPEE